MMYPTGVFKIIILTSLATLTVASNGTNVKDIDETVVIKAHGSSYQALDVINKSPAELIRMRGFKAKVHYARTKDGYYIQVVHLINPQHSEKQLKRPVIFNHGLLESATIWLINSLGVKPLPRKDLCGEIDVGNSTTFYLNAPMMLANSGYDVWLMSMRGTDWSLRHDRYTKNDSEFWNYCLDDFGLVDVPSVIDYVRRKTGASKVGYIGHSQATFSVFGLLSARPKYARVIEPVIAVAPVAYMHHTTSLARPLFLGTLTATNKDDHAAFPPFAKRIRNSFAEFCGEGEKTAREEICQLIEMLISGAGKRWLKGYFSHLPFYTSLKVLRQFGQLIRNERYTMYDYGEEINLKLYGTKQSQSYPVEKIRSKSLCLIRTKSDSLARPEDVELFKKRLTVPIYKEIFIDRDFNHFDLITDVEAGHLVNKPILEIFEALEEKTGVCLPEIPEEEEVSNKQVVSNSIESDSNNRDPESI